MSSASGFSICMIIFSIMLLTSLIITGYSYNILKSSINPMLLCLLFAVGLVTLSTGLVKLRQYIIDYNNFKDKKQRKIMGRIKDVKRSTSMGYDNSIIYYYIPTIEYKENNKIKRFEGDIPSTSQKEYISENKIEVFIDEKTGTQSILNIADKIKKDKKQISKVK